MRCSDLFRFVGDVVGLVLLWASTIGLTIILYSIAH